MVVLLFIIIVIVIVIAVVIVIVIVDYSKPILFLITTQFPTQNNNF